MRRSLGITSPKSAQDVTKRRRWRSASVPCDTSRGPGGRAHVEESDPAAAAAPRNRDRRCAAGGPCLSTLGANPMLPADQPTAGGRTELGAAARQGAAAGRGGQGAEPE